MGRRYRKEIDSSRKLLQLLSLSLSLGISIFFASLLLLSLFLSLFFFLAEGEKRGKYLQRGRRREVGNKSWDEKRRGKVRKRAAWRRLHAVAPPPILFWFYLFRKFVCVPQCVCRCVALYECVGVCVCTLWFTLSSKRIEILYFVSIWTVVCSLRSNGRRDSIESL